MHLICAHKSRKSTSYGIVLMLHHHVMAIVKNVKKIRFLLCYSIHKHLQQLLYIINMIKNINNRHIYHMIVQKLSEYLQFSKSQ